jgi:FMN phosphatase YigB (HAD superfamily)
MSGWIGVDLDGTLAHYEGWNNGSIGEPIPAMMERVQKWLRDGKEVRIFTARASDPTQKQYVEHWLHDNGLSGLEVTNVKDFRMIELWDDRAVQVIPNTGQALQENIIVVNDLRRVK